VWIPGVVSRDTVAWAARRRYPYVMLATRLEPTKQSFDYYDEVAREEGYEAGPQHHSYLFKVHVDETEELAYETGRKFLEGPGNIFLEGSRGRANRFVQALPGLSSRTNVLPTAQVLPVAQSRGRAEADAPEDPNVSVDERERRRRAIYDTQLENSVIITGTPKSVIPKVRAILEYLRPGSIFFWDGDGDMNHDDAMRSLRLMGEEVIPAVRAIGEELGLASPYEIDPATNLAIGEGSAVRATNGRMPASGSEVAGQPTA
jgi:alkanesulfonate monooxygenase SsuD/methylene tetrahydromethanopterin reductase-like flavin-dependent oxidoreductase (luciferase family)